MKLPYKLELIMKYNIKKPDEKDPVTVSHFIMLATPAMIRDLVLATRLQGHPLPKEVVPALYRIMDRLRYHRVNSYTNVWKRLCKMGDMELVTGNTCSYCNGSGKYSYPPGVPHQATYDCSNCAGKGYIDTYKYIGPVV